MGGRSKLIALLISIASLLALPVAAHAVDPVGNFDGISSYPGGVVVAGWASDHDAINTPLAIHVYVKSNATGQQIGYALAENQNRDDVANAGHGRPHGFSLDIQTPITGDATVCVYAIGVGAGGNTGIGCKGAHILDPNPFGNVDSAVGGPGQVSITGWAADHSDNTVPLNVRVQIGSTDAQMLNLVANGSRPDLQSALGIPPNHGYSTTVGTNKRGPQPVCVWAQNVGVGSDKDFGCRTVTIAAPPLPTSTDYLKPGSTTSAQVPKTVPTTPTTPQPGTPVFGPPGAKNHCRAVRNRVRRGKRLSIRCARISARLRVRIVRAGKTRSSRKVRFRRGRARVRIGVRRGTYKVVVTRLRGKYVGAVTLKVSGGRR